MAATGLFSSIIVSVQSETETGQGKNASEMKLTLLKIGLRTDLETKTNLEYDKLLHVELSYQPFFTSKKLAAMTVSCPL